MAGFLHAARHRRDIVEGVREGADASADAMTTTIKLLSLMEATTVTGPAKHLIGFSREARSVKMTDAGLPRVEGSIVTFHRAPEGDGDLEAEAPNAFVAAAREAGIEVDVVRE